ncbi:hypothetical protein JZ751_022668 [Albula glossodonta]|uniref:Ragulator complex protein LAMTOR1 n=1 Tax=Albula glossodonta TaxID=121402 RepID=A0A8T2PMM2_9TELE|nr:hypothetical protein JZ751_022668 [Albula glossodonta]
MGCCYSSETGSTEQEEVTKLLPDPNPDSKTNNGMDQNTSSPPSYLTDEQALLSNIIDVSASDSQGMEQHEYMDKTRQYSTRLAMFGEGLSQKKPAILPTLTSQPHQVLASDLISHQDLQQVSKIAAYAHSAISQIKVDAKEDLVVQFAIP